MDRLFSTVRNRIIGKQKVAGILRGDRKELSRLGRKIVKERLEKKRTRDTFIGIPSLDERTRETFELVSPLDNVDSILLTHPTESQSNTPVLIVQHSGEPSLEPPCTEDNGLVTKETSVKNPIFDKTEPTPTMPSLTLAEKDYSQWTKKRKERVTNSATGSDSEPTE